MMKKKHSNSVILKSLHNLYFKITNSRLFNIQRRRLIFKPEKNTPIQNSYVNNMNFDKEKHDHRPNTSPAVENQTLINNKKKKKRSQ